MENLSIRLYALGKAARMRSALAGHRLVTTPLITSAVHCLGEPVSQHPKLMFRRLRQTGATDGIAPRCSQSCGEPAVTPWRRNCEPEACRSER